MTFLFPDLGRLHAALLSGSVPSEVLEAPCFHGRIGKGVWIHTTAVVPPTVLPDHRGDRPDVGTAALCWPEALPTESAPLPDDLPEVLFEIPERELLPLAGELLRLGCDRQRWASRGRRAWILAVAPPWYTVLVQTEQHRVFHATADRVWVELGAQHGFAQHLKPNTPVLIPANGPWRQIPDGPWTDLYQQLDVVLPAPVEHPAGELPRLHVPLHLVPGSHQDQPLLWVLHDRALEQLEALLARVPQRALASLRFAVTEGEQVQVILRAPNTQTVQELGLRAQAFAQLLSLSNAFRPVHTTLEPPLRVEAIRALLDVRANQVAWITRCAQGVQVHHLDQRAFRPLSEWVEYVMHRDEKQLAPWIESSTFRFGRWTDIGREWAEPEHVSPQPDPVELVPPRQPPKPEPARPKAQRRVTPVVVVPVETDAERTRVFAELTLLEEQFLALDSPPDGPERLPLWPRMAALLQTVGRDREARLAWSQALWHSRDEAIAAAWAAVEMGQLGLRPDQLPVDPEHSWPLAVCLIAGALAPTPALATHFDQHDRNLDVRTAWLVREVLAQADELALARARDTILGRLRTGLLRGVDVPSFLGRTDSATRDTIATQLETQLTSFQKTKRTRSVLEAPVKQTLGYVSLVFAWGFAAVGLRERAETLRSVSLDLNDPIHAALVGAYQARIDQALHGLPLAISLPMEARQRFHALKGIEKYKVDRLRSASGILTPRERLDPFKAYTLEGTTSTLDFGRLEGADLVVALEAALTDLDPQSLHRLLLALPGVPVATAVSMLGRLEMSALAPEERLPLHVDALTTAGLLNERPLALRHAEQLEITLGEVTSEQLSQAVAPLVKGFRELRRLGLEDLATRTLDRVLDLATGQRFVDLLTRTAAAGGLALQGDIDRALPLLDEALQTSMGTFQRPVDQQRLIRTLSTALSLAPRTIGLPRLQTLGSILNGITDSFNTNSHFCFSVIDFAESIVLGHTDRQLLEDPRIRTFVLDDEFLMRTRIG